MSADERPWLTIATVVKDDASGLARTLASVRAQTDPEFEYVVVDSSSDQSVVPGLLDGFGRYEWAEPRGIYPAMNTALDLATGRFVMFMNAGDTLFDSSVVGRARMVAEQTSPAWMFGEVEIRELSGRTVVTSSWDFEQERRHSFARGRFPCHQGTFAGTDLLRSIGRFDMTYRIAADYAAFLRMSLVAAPVHLDFVIARFEEGGVSTTRWAESFREFHRARRSILQPSGLAAVREYGETVKQFAAVGLHRGVVSRVRRP